MGSGRLAIIPARALDDARLSRPALVTLAALGTYADRDGWCHPSVGAIAKRLDVARTTVSGHIKELRRLGYIEVEERQVAGKGQVANRYRVLFDGDLPAKDDRYPLSDQPTPPVGSDSTPPIRKENAPLLSFTDEGDMPSRPLPADSAAAGVTSTLKTQ